MCPAAPVRRPERRCPGKFEDETSNKADYQKWKLGPRHEHKKPEYKPLCDPFDGTTTARDAFVQHGPAARESFKPSNVPCVSDQPLDECTDYRDNYVRHPMPPPFVRERPPLDQNCAPMDGLTNYRKDYTEKSSATQSCRPDRRPLVSDFPFQKETTQKVDYIKWPVCPPLKHNMEAYQPPVGCMSGDTNYRIAYDVKPLCPNPSMKPNRKECTPGKFDDMTSNKADYVRWNSRPAEQRKPDPYQPLCDPFDGEPTYRRDYIEHRPAFRESMRPSQLPVVSDACIDDDTEYRVNYTKKLARPCPARNLKHGSDTCYSFKEEDLTGHQFFEPTNDSSCA